ncbi:MAG: hypothetical protein IPM54_33380 [Polyangiaceae bacterium]|nr:hypothetical protein [Polyangiaceae bacterium]
MGTPAYMAPEQIPGHDAVDARADVYALGAILFEILTLSRLRPGTRVDEIMRAALSGVPTQPSEHVPSIAPELDALCMRALAQEPEDRLSSARELAEGVERYLDGDRDLKLRQDLARTHVERAKAFKESEAHAGGLVKAEASVDVANALDQSPRVMAVREVIQGLALDPEDRAAQRLFVELIVNTTEVPPEAMPELERARDKARAETLRSAVYGLRAWLAVLPLAFVIGVHSKLAVGATAAVDVMAALFALFYSRRQRIGAGVPIALSVLVAATVALSSCYLGPFALVPTCAVSAMLIYAMHATPYERRVGVVVFVAFTSLPFVGELTGVLGRSYVFEADRLIILARAVALPETATLLAMLYSTLSFIVFSAWIVGRMRDALSASEQQKLVQSWLLRRLFPDAMAER